MPLQQRGKVLELDLSRSGGISEDNNDDINSELDGANLSNTSVFLSLLPLLFFSIDSFDSKDEPSYERNMYYQKISVRLATTTLRQ